MAAISSLRLRRALSLSSSILNHHHHKLLSTSIPAAPQLSLSSQSPNKPDLLNILFQSRAFRSSNVSLSSRSRMTNFEDSKISPDDILFEGCDYNHWLITIDFPKDPKPSPEEMVETYVQTAAQVLGSVEEAKKRIYACSTTTYQGFQVEVSEETSKKFEGLPGVVFILPDSYIDPVNKEYGGDKYINGTIIPRPPPVQYGRSSGRYGDRNRDVNRPNQPRGPYQQGNSTYDNQRPIQGDPRNFGPQQNPPPQQSYGPSSVGERRDPSPMNNSPRGAPTFSSQGNYNQGQRVNSYSQGPQDFPTGDQKTYATQQGGNYGQEVGAGGNDGQGAGGNYWQGGGGSHGHGGGGNYGQGSGGNYRQGSGGNNGQGSGGNYRQGSGGNYGQGSGGNYGQGSGGNYRQGSGGNYRQGSEGNYGQRAVESFGQGAVGGSGQEMGANYVQSYSGHGENHRFPQEGEMNNMQQGQQRNYSATGQSGTEHGRY